MEWDGFHLVVTARLQEWLTRVSTPNKWLNRLNHGSSEQNLHGNGCWLWLVESPLTSFLHSSSIQCSCLFGAILTSKRKTWSRECCLIKRQNAMVSKTMTFFLAPKKGSLKTLVPICSAQSQRLSALISFEMESQWAYICQEILIF